MEIFEAKDDSGWFRNKKITFGELEKYVLENSEMRDAVPVTELQTRIIENKLTALDSDVAALRAFLLSNIAVFSTVREKTRYYFCKYLYYYLNGKIEAYFRAYRKGHNVEDALSGLLPLKIVTTLRRNPSMPEEEKRKRIQESAISSGAIFDEFNYFYFGYISIDWVEILMECYQSVAEIPAIHKRAWPKCSGRPGPNGKNYRMMKCSGKKWLRLKQKKKRKIQWTEAADTERIVWAS